MTNLNPFKIHNALSLRTMHSCSSAFAILTIGLFTIFGMTSCEDDSKKPTDTLGKGTTKVSIDESFRPVMENQLAVFHSNYPEAQVIPSFTSETQCFKDFFGDSTRVIIVSRPATEEELKYAEQNKIVVNSVALAKDAIAVVLHPDNKDTALSVAQLKGILTGVFPKKYTVVFDHEGSSMLHFINDSILQGEPLGKNVFAAKTNEGVVEYVAQNKDAIGFVGLSYVSDTGDSINEAFLAKVKLAALYNEKEKDFFQPYQAYVALQHYPLTRTLYYVSREHYPGLATGFVNFLSKERGQLIFSKFRLFPLKMNIVIREAAINTD